MFNPTALRKIIAYAKREGFDPASLLAVAEVESLGKPFMDDGVTPRFLFERHKFWAGLKLYAPGLIPTAEHQGLAHKDWRRNTQYKDQGTMAKRMVLFNRAKALNEEAAYYACSWGLGQVMGFHHYAHGFSKPSLFVKWMTKGGIPAQVEAMGRTLKQMGLKLAVNTQKWAVVEKKYNGGGLNGEYARKMAAAYAKWKDGVKPYLTEAPEAEPTEVPTPTPVPSPTPVPLPTPTEPEAPAPKPKGGFLEWLIGIGAGFVAYIEAHPLLTAGAILVLGLAIGIAVHKMYIRRKA